MSVNAASVNNAAMAALQAMKQAQAGAAQAAGRIVSGRTADAAAIVQLMTAQTQFEAAAATLVAADEMTGTLLDIKT